MQKFIYSVANSEKAILAGVVTKVNYILHGTRKAIVEMVDFTGSKWSVFFSNREDRSAAQMADRVERAKVGPGAFIAILGYFHEDKKDANGIDFQYRGIMTQKTVKTNPDGTTTEGEVNVLIGKAMRPFFMPAKDGKPAMFKLRMPIDQYNKEKGEKVTKWVDITFFDDEKRKSASFAKSLFEKAIAPGKIGDLDEEGKEKLFPVNCAIRAGAPKERTGKDGKIYIGYTGYDIVMDFSANIKTSAEGKEEGTPPATAHEAVVPDNMSVPEAFREETDPVADAAEAEAEGFMPAPPADLDQVDW